MKFATLIFFSFSINVIINTPFIDAVTVILYENPNNQGESYESTFEGSVCHEIPASFDDRASSLNTVGGCVSLFENHGCSGLSVNIAPGGLGWDVTADVKMDNKASSMKECPNITLYTEPNFGGSCFGSAFHKVPLSTQCVNLPPDFVSTVSSIDLNGRCAQLYGQTDCILAGALSTLINPWTDGMMDLTMTYGESYDNKAVSLNVYTCNMALYTGVGFTGDFKVFYPDPPGQCINLEAPLYQNVSSVSGQNCFNLWTEADCTGSMQIVYMASINLGSFGSFVKSASNCPLGLGL